MSIADEKYLSLTTYRTNGEPRAVPVWIAPLGDERIGFTTAATTFKVRRIRADDRVMLQPCDARGNVRDGTEAVTGTAEVLTGADVDPVVDRIKAKYGYQVTLIRALARVKTLLGRGDGPSVAIAITLD